jgi:hypothetical protein
LSNHPYLPWISASSGIVHPPVSLMDSRIHPYFSVESRIHPYPPVSPMDSHTRPYLSWNLMELSNHPYLPWISASSGIVHPPVSPMVLCIHPYLPWIPASAHISLWNRASIRTRPYLPWIPPPTHISLWILTTIRISHGLPYPPTPLCGIPHPSSSPPILPHFQISFSFFSRPIPAHPPIPPSPFFLLSPFPPPPSGSACPSGWACMSMNKGKERGRAGLGLGPPFSILRGGEIFGDLGVRCKLE